MEAQKSEYNTGQAIFAACGLCALYGTLIACTSVLFCLGFIAMQITLHVGVRWLGD